MLKRNVFRLMAVAVMLAWGTGATAQQAASVVQVYKSATCGCCSKWVDHLRENKFSVRTTDVADMEAVKARYKVPAALQSCHTAIVGGLRHRRTRPRG